MAKESNGSVMGEPYSGIVRIYLDEAFGWLGFNVDPASGLHDESIGTTVRLQMMNKYIPVNSSKKHR